MKRLKTILLSLIMLIPLCEISAQTPELIDGTNTYTRFSYIEHLIGFNGLLYFSAYEEGGKRQVFQSDGTIEGTKILKRIFNNNGELVDAWPNNFTVAGGLMYFNAYDCSNCISKLWVTDGTEAGTRILRQFNSDNSNGMDYAIAIDNQLFFVIDTQEYGVELWKTDGTEQGTMLVKDIIPGTLGSAPSNFMILDNELFFYANDTIHGYELWKTDGSESGTVLVKDINVGTQDSYKYIGSKSEKYETYNGFLFFSANDGVHGFELWKTDGTEAGTVMIKDINNGVNNSNPSDFKVFENVVYFSAADSMYQDYNYIPPHLLYNTELYRTDGTEAGTYLVKDINMDEKVGSKVSNLMVLNNHLLFTASEHGMFSGELWSTDGTANGTHCFDLYPGENDSNPTFFASTPNLAFFSAQQNDTGYDIWVTYGEDHNTKMVYNVVDNLNKTTARDLTIVDSVLYFTTDDHQKLWRLTGINNVNCRKDPTVKVYPIPFNDELFIEYGGEYNKTVLINIYNQLGQKIVSEVHNSSEIVAVRNLSYLDAGLYVVEFIIDNNSEYQKVIKTNSKK